jgi:hypothetical protein
MFAYEFLVCCGIGGSGKETVEGVFVMFFDKSANIIHRVALQIGTSVEFELCQLVESYPLLSI